MKCIMGIYNFYKHFGLRLTIATTLFFLGLFCLITIFISAMLNPKFIAFNVVLGFLFLGIAAILSVIELYK